jgi:phenylacetate-CoA ligase
LDEERIIMTSPADDQDTRPTGVASEDPHDRPFWSVVGAYGRGLFEVTPQVLATPRLPADVIRRMSFSRLRETIDHAIRHVSFYRERFAAAGVTEAPRSAEELARLPLLTRVLHREHWPDMISDTVTRSEVLQQRSANVSRARLLFDPVRELPRRIQELRLLAAHGFRPWHRQMLLDQPEHLAPGRFLPQRLGLWRREQFPTQRGVETALEWLRGRKPEVIHGVASSLRLLAAVVRKSGGLGYTPRIVVSKDGFLDSTTRTVMESSFGARVVDYFGTEEAGIVAWRCPSDSGFHVDEDLVYVETIREDGTPTEQGERGDLVLTNLYMRAMPIIRLRVGVRAVLSRERCRCGRGLALLKGLRESQLENITTPAGGSRPPEALSRILEGISGLKGFRLVQTQEECLWVVVCWNSSLSDAAKQLAGKNLVRALRDELGARMQIDLREVATFFPPGRSEGRTVPGRLPRM